jgi:hypothetical protein
VIQITPQMRILVAIEAVDGRKGIDSLARLCQEKLQSDPFSGGLCAPKVLSLLPISGGINSARNDLRNDLNSQL